jgi:hypothetical protein
MIRLDLAAAREKWINEAKIAKHLPPLRRRIGRDPSFYAGLLDLD